MTRYLLKHRDNFASTLSVLWDWEWEVDGTGLRLWSLVDFGISVVESLGTTTKEFISCLVTSTAASVFDKNV